MSEKKCSGTLKCLEIEQIGQYPYRDEVEFNIVVWKHCEKCEANKGGDKMTDELVENVARHLSGFKDWAGAREFVKEGWRYKANEIIPIIRKAVGEEYAIKYVKDLVRRARKDYLGLSDNEQEFLSVLSKIIWDMERVKKAVAEEIKTWAIRERKRLSQKKARLSTIKPQDIQGQIVIGGKIKAFQQMIDKLSGTTSGKGEVAEEKATLGRITNPFYETLFPNCLEREADYNRGRYEGFEKFREILKLLMKGEG